MTTKVKKINDADMSSIFNNMLGAGEISNLNIIYPKYCQLEGYFTSVIEIIEKFARSPFMSKYKEVTEKHSDEMIQYCESAKHHIEFLFRQKIPTEYEWNPDNAPDDIKKELSEGYATIKTHSITVTFINLCDRLIKYRRYLMEEDKLSHRFIINMPDIEFTPFPFAPTFDIKGIFMNMEGEKEEFRYLSKEEKANMEKINAHLVEFCMIVMHKLLKISYNIYKVVTSPDVDVDEFVDIIVKSIDKIRNQPSLSRCGRAFNKIRDSIYMLKNNFSEYYKDFLETKNSTIIMENFVIDVSKNTASDPQLMQQFRQIISHYRTLAKHNIQDPRLRSLFDRINDQFTHVDKSHPNIVNIEKGAESEYIDPEDAAMEEKEKAIRLAEEKAIEDAKESSKLRRQQELNANKSVDQLLKEMGVSSSNPGGKNNSSKGKKK